MAQVPVTDPDGWQPYPETRPPNNEKECLIGYDFYSHEVLFTDGREIYIGRLEQIDASETGFDPEWIESGPDGYRQTCVTHWRPLPPLPGKG